MERARIEGPVLWVHGNGPQSVPPVLHPARGARSMMMIIGLHLWHRAAEDRLVLLVDHMPGPVAAVQQSYMSGACQELATFTSPASARVSARLLCSPASVARRRNL